MPDSNHTFIIPAYKNSVFIEKCIISLKQQTVPSEILITTSTPSSFLLEISARHNIELHVNENGNSIANDWSFAYKMCKTKYLTLAHQDDLYLPDYTRHCLDDAEKDKNRDCLIIFTDYKEYEFDQPRKNSPVLYIKNILLISFLIKNNIRNRFLKKSILSFGNPISCPSVMFNTENIGPFEFSEAYHYNTDWEAWLRLAKMKGRFIYIKEKLMVHRLHSESQTTIQIGNNNRYAEEEKIFQSIWSKPIAKIIMKIYSYSSSFSRLKA